MSFLTYVHVGRTTLWRGAPFRVAVKLEPMAEAETVLPGPVFPSVVFELAERRDSEGVFGEAFEGEGKPSLSGGIDLKERGRGLAEVPTESLSVGAHELTFRIAPDASVESLAELSPEAVTVSELISVLERGEFAKLVDEQLAESFRPSRALPAGQVPVLVGELIHELLSIHALRHDFEHLIKEQATAGADRVQLPPPQPYGLWPWEFTQSVLDGDALFPEDPILWVTAKLLEAVNELQVGGFSVPPKAVVTVDPSAPAVGLRFALTVSEPISAELAESLTDPELSEVAQVRRGAEGADVELAIAPGAQDVTLNAMLPTSGFPLVAAGSV